MTISIEDQEALFLLKQFTKLSPLQWQMVEIAVAKAGGITNVKGHVLQELHFCAERARSDAKKGLLR
jgi:hypothetical protein